MFYDNFVKYSVKMGLSPSAAAEQMGFKRSALSRWKNGSEPRGYTLEKMAAFFGCTVRELVSGEVAEDDLRELRQALRDRPELRGLMDATMKLPASRVYEMMALLSRWEEEKND
jgi:transcriptional regulator with XRE-family HTH domain